MILSLHQLLNRPMGITTTITRSRTRKEDSANSKVISLARRNPGSVSSFLWPSSPLASRSWPSFSPVSQCALLPIPNRSPPPIRNGIDHLLAFSFLSALGLVAGKRSLSVGSAVKGEVGEMMSVYTKVLESEECVQRIICELGCSASGIPAKSYIFP